MGGGGHGHGTKTNSQIVDFFRAFLHNALFMKFTVSSEQREYFRKNGILPLSGLLNASELKDLNQAMDEVMKRADPFLHGRDLWRGSPLIKKIVFSSRLLGLAFELVQKKPLRLAFDQLLPEQSEGKPVDFYSDQPFQDISCINDLTGLFLIAIKSQQPSEVEEGSGFFFLPSVSFPFLTLPPSNRYLLIGYGGLFSQYLYRPQDPHAHYLKSLGYVFGDKLNEKFHPILLR
jgi:hypothetical protein